MTEIIINFLLNAFGKEAIEYAKNQYSGPRSIAELKAYIKQKRLSICAIFLTLLSIYRLFLIYEYRATLYGEQTGSPFISKYTHNFKIYLLTSIILLIVFIYSYFIYGEILKKRVNEITFISILIIVLSFFTTMPLYQSKFYEVLELEAFNTAVALYKGERFDESGLIFTHLNLMSDNPNIRANSEGFLAGIDLNSGNPEESIEKYSCLLFKHHSHENITFNQISLQWAIYQLGQKLPIDKAEAFIIQTKKKCPIERLSPFWLGISQKNYSNYVDDLIDDMKATDEDRVILQHLILKYPHDPYADFARLFLGEYQFIADNSPNSKYRDWGLYVTGRNAYFDGEFEKAITYLNQFWHEFPPPHRWADYATDKLVRSYELNGQYEQALTVLLKIESPTVLLSSKDGLVHGYRLVLIDTYFSADDLADFINKRIMEGNLSHLFLLEFSLAEQLLKENRWIESREKFLELQQQYSDNSEAILIEHNLQLLDKIIKINELSDPDNVIGLAKLLLSDPNTYPTIPPQSLVFYNDLYQGHRTYELRKVSKLGVSWEYISKNNDYLRAITLLDNFLGNSPNSPIVPEALYLSITGYYYLTLPAAFLPSSLYPINNIIEIEYREQLKQQEKDIILENLERLSEQILEHRDSIYTPEALTIAALGFRNFGEPKDTAKYMRQVYELYPQHNLANNALIYNARLYHSLAKADPDPSLQQVYFNDSISLYKKIIDEYPSGHVGEEAKEELETVRIELQQLKQEK